MAKAGIEVEFCKSKLIDETKAAKLEVCVIAAMVGCNITNKQFGAASFLQYDKQQRKLVGAYVLHLMFCYVSGQNMEKEFELSPHARQLFDDAANNKQVNTSNTRGTNEKERLLEKKLAKLYKVCFLK